MRLLLILFFSLLSAILPPAHFSLSALDFSLRPKGFMFVPMGPGNVHPDGHSRYGLGGGADAGFELDLSTVWPNAIGLGYTAGLEGNFLSKSMMNDDSSAMQVLSLGAVLGLYFFPLDRIFTRIDGTLGIYKAASGGESSPAHLFLRAGGELGFRFTPGFTLAANTGWRHFFADNGNHLSSGLYAGLTAQITFRTGSQSRRDGVGATLDQYEAIYPAFMQLYQSNPIGTVVIRNNENAEIRDVRLSFRASGYTASEFSSGSVPFIARGVSARLPLFADFSPDVLRFTDTGRVLGELVIRYRFLGEEREVVRAVTIAVNNRNEVTLGNPSALAAFISPTSPEILDYARFIAGLARRGWRTGHNQNMNYAIWLFEALRMDGIRLGTTFSGVTEVKFPVETLLLGTGTRTDLAMLFAAGLESVGISSAFVQTEDDFLVAVSLGIGQSAAETFFNGHEKILIINDEVWLPLSMSEFNNGFMAAWNAGALALNRTFKTGSEADFVIVADAWASYPPAPLPNLGGDIIATKAETAVAEVNRVLQQYINQELTPHAQRIQTQINNNATAALYNRLAILQARSGNIAAAKANYERAAGMGSIPAMNNRGNLALIERDYTTAERWFRQALARESQNAAALRGMERVEGNR